MFKFIKNFVIGFVVGFAAVFSFLTAIGTFLGIRAEMESTRSPSGPWQDRWEAYLKFGNS